jgi:hypothetical protein
VQEFAEDVAGLEVVEGGGGGLPGGGFGDGEVGTMGNRPAKACWPDMAGFWPDRVSAMTAAPLREW